MYTGVTGVSGDRVTGVRVFGVAEVSGVPLVAGVMVTRVGATGKLWSGSLG